MASGEFKARHRNHTKSFRNEKYENETELSKFVWKLKRKNVEFRVNFEILSIERPYQKETGYCSMCSREKLEIAKNIKKYGSKSLNRRWKIFRRCLHRGEHLLGSINTRHKNATADEVAESQVGEEMGGMEGPGGVLDLGEGEREGVNRHIEQTISFGQTRSGRQWRDPG